jgi:hypothetical protein
VSELYTFPPAPSPDAIEWPGVPIGASNVITRTKTRTAVHDKTIDRVEGRRDALVDAAVAHITRRGDREPLFRYDVIIHGVRVRATTNSEHLCDFWVDNWYSPQEWKALTGLTPPREPQVTVFALGGVSDQPEAAYYSRKTSTIIFFNTAYYGQLKSWVLGAVGRVLAEDYGIHSVHGACVEKNGRGILYIAPTGTGKSTSSYGLVTFPQTRFHSDDWVYVRYTYRTTDGHRLHPMRVTLADGAQVRGYQTFRWLESDVRAHAGAMLTGLDLENQEVTVPVTALDFTAPVEAYAFTSEKIFYLRTNLVENFPSSAVQILRSKLENVPEVTAAYLERNGAQLDGLAEALRAEGGEVTEYFAQHSREDLKHLLARLIAFDNARAMLEVGKILPPARIFTNPMEPAHLSTVVLLRRDPTDRLVAARLTLPQFMTALLIGETPDHKREIAYNAYRAVDDEAEQAFIASLEDEVKTRRGAMIPEELHRTFQRRPDVPETLRQEFELFRVMHRTCTCYTVNTVLTADPLVQDRKEAVRLTMELIARLVDEQPQALRLALDTYRGFLTAPEAARPGDTGRRPSLR